MKKERKQAIETYKIFLFDVKRNTKSENLGTYTTLDEAKKEVVELRRQGLPAFWQKMQEKKW